MRSSAGSRQGIAMGVAFFVLFILFATGLVISHLSRGLQRQVEYADASVRAQYIAETALNLLTSRLMNSRYEARWFARNPDAQAGVEYGGGSYDYFICDSPGRPLYADIWVRSNYRGTRRFYFWRVKFQTPLLTGLANGVMVNGTEVEGSQFPATPRDLDRHSAAIESQLEKRKKNRNGAGSMADTIQTTNDVTQAINNVGAPPGYHVAKVPFAADPTDHPFVALPEIVIPPVSAHGPKIDVPPIILPGTIISQSEKDLDSAAELIIQEIDEGFTYPKGWSSELPEVGPEGVKMKGKWKKKPKPNPNPKPPGGPPPPPGGPGGPDDWDDRDDPGRPGGPGPGGPRDPRND